MGAFVSLSAVLSAQAVPSAPKKKRAPAAPAKRAAAVPARRTGEQIYAQLCASCHGPKGEGAKAYPKPLVGNRSIGELAPFIAKTMPPGGRHKWVGDEAQKVAAYLHGAFYSPLAQERNRPARVELARMTVRQYRNAVADLVGSFRTPAKPEDRRGLRGEYFKSRRFRSFDRVLERVDPEVRFDFGDAAPDPGLDAYQYSIRWEGSVVAPETGEYEFIVKTDHALRLYVNDLQQPVIDAYVKSGSDTVYKGALFLLGGRTYPLRLEFLKSQQGVNNQEKLRQKPPEKAFISLEWKQPKRAAEVIPQRLLVPALHPESFVPTAPFPPDDRSIGYERGTSVTKEWDEATTEGAIEAASYVSAHLAELSGVKENAPDRAAKLKEFSKQFVARAFRRPLTPELEQVYVERQFQGVSDPETAVRRVVLLTLKSPRFLYPGFGEDDQYAVASRLAFSLWDSLPDAELLKAAAAGQLATREQVVQQAERMVADPRARAKMRDFFLQWLKVEHYPDLAKDAKRYADFDETVANDLRTSLEMLLEHVVWSEKSDFRELLLTDKAFLNGRLAFMYGANLPKDAPFTLTPLNPQERAGVLTHPYVLASFAYLDTSSPIHRGVMIARSILGRALQPPPEAFTPVPAELHPKLTTRQRVAMQTKPAACASCHDLINPLGFTLEKFDAVGRLRVVENGQNIDATGSYLSRSGKLVRFSGAKSLATFLAGSEEVHAAFVEQLFQHLVKQPVLAYGPQTLPSLQRSFVANEFSIRKQIVETVALAAAGKPKAVAAAK